MGCKTTRLSDSPVAFLVTLLRAVDIPYLCLHLTVNMVSVDVLNYIMEMTFCSNVLLACCNPFNKAGPFRSIPLKLGPNGWLVGHFFAYTFAGCTYGKLSHVVHANLVLCQIAWFTFEWVTYQHTYAWEQLVFYRNGTHPCPSEIYFSTWIPIWQDFPYNTAGQLLGAILYQHRNAMIERLKTSSERALRPVRLADNHAATRSPSRARFEDLELSMPDPVPI